jgi:hypothetical protein
MLLISWITVSFLSSGLLLAQDQKDDPRWTQRTAVQFDPTASSPASLVQENYIPSTTPRIYHTPAGTLVISPNVRVHPTTVSQQNEVYLARHPLNPNIMYGAAHSFRGSFLSVGTYVTTDGGDTWFGSDTMNAPNLNDQRGDPAPAIDKNGRFHYVHLSSATNFGALTGIGANYSTDNGLSWSATFPIVNDANVDKELSWTDDAPASPYYGNVYTAWTSFGTSPANGHFARSTDAGVTWTQTVTQLNTTPTGHNAQGHDGRVGPNGEVYVCWSAGNTASPFTEDFIGFAKSTNGGVNFTVTENAFDVNGSRSTSFNGWAIRTNSFPRMDVDKSGGSRNGWIYIVTSEINLAPSGSDADIILHRSTDGGATWSSAIRVNQDPLNDGKVQFFPAVRVDEAGGVNAVYYDNRNFPSVGDSCDVYVSRSLDGGNTWTDIQASDHHFRPKNTPGVNTMGDYIGITSGASKLWPFWMDDFVGARFHAWTTSVSIADPLDPYPPSNVSAFSDFTIPTSMLLRWQRPTTLINGSPIGPFVTRIKRNGVQIAERPSTDTTFTDGGLTTGTTYTYSFSTRLTNNDSLSSEVQASWIAGGARIPKAPTNLAVTGTQAAGYKVRWTNPSRQIDNTRLNDLAGIRIYRDGTFLRVLTRSVADTARADSTTDNPAAGPHRYYVTAIDNEVPINESAPSNSGDSPLDLPLSDGFSTVGAPNPLLWVNRNAVIDGDAVTPPSPPNALNLAGNTTGIGLDTVTSNSIDLSGQAGRGMTLGYFQQPQGIGDPPEAGDSLIAEALNSLGQWVRLKVIPGAAIRPFTFERFKMDSVSAAGGTYFFNGFKFRFRSLATTVTSTRQDDWFIDDVFFGLPNTTPAMAVSPQQIVDTVLAGRVDSTSYTFAVQNTNPYGTSLNYTIVENPAVTWLAATPTSGSVLGLNSNTIQAKVDFRGVAQGLYTTKLIISGNDPGNASDTVNVSFRVNNAPSARVSPDSIHLALHLGDSVASSLKIRNTGLGQLTYTSSVSGGYSGQAATSIGDSSVLITGGNNLQGGVVSVTTPVQLIEIRSWLNTTASRELRFVVYEGTSPTGTFTKIFENTIANSGTGTQFYSSGPINVSLQAGKFYAIGVSWSGLLIYYYSATTPVPAPISFGTITGGLSQATFPPPATLTQTATSNLYCTQLVTATGKWLTVTSGGSGTVAAGDSATLAFKIKASLLPPGVARASLLVNTNDPLSPVITVPFGLDVLTSVAQEGTSIPQTYELSQNFPNPFNPITKIKFALPHESTVRLAVFNILGQEVATLVDGSEPAGYFTAQWDGRNKIGNPAASGVYFFRLKATATDGTALFANLKKMLLLK